jgi:hypothetical protein
VRAPVRKNAVVPSRSTQSLASTEPPILEPSKTFGDIEGFIDMLLAACEDPTMNATLQMLLSQPDERRRAIVYRLLERMRERQAPPPLIDAMACLLDDAAAEKAYQVIYQCARKESGAS